MVYAFFVRLLRLFGRRLVGRLPVFTDAAVEGLTVFQFVTILDLHDASGLRPRFKRLDLQGMSARPGDHLSCIIRPGLSFRFSNDFLLAEQSGTACMAITGMFSNNTF
ncbi:hypothetical protein [Ruegeria faecimaris]|uniref:hypothetical protein n=1 Tax=Ruegeria faecimaris TaxID=686389 RepID=UPI00233060EE|nr:hypothetical protein [Ruegeria faecimaris]